MKSLRKVLSVVLALAMVLGTVAFAFADDAEAVEYSDAVKVLKALDVLVGDTNGNLNLDEYLTREQAAKLIAYFFAGNFVADHADVTILFDDVAADRWSAKYVTLGVSAGILNGYNATTFGPEDCVTGTQFSKMLLACLGYKDLTGQDWAAKVTLALDNTEIENPGLAPITRAEAAELCFAALKSNVVNAKGEVVKNLAFTETIANDDVLQLGEKLYPTLTRAAGTEGYIWSYNGIYLGITESFDEFVANEGEGYYEPAEKAWTYPLIGLDFLQKYDYDRPGLFARIFNPVFSRINAKIKADVQYAYDVLQAENIILFSTDGENYSPLLTAKAGQKVFVKANDFTLNLFKYFGGKLPETLVSNTAAKELTRDDFVELTQSKWLKMPVGFARNTVAEISLPKNDMNFFDKADTYIDATFHNAVLKLIENFDEKYQRNDIVELNLIQEATNGNPAIYCFVMPNRAVTTYDFTTGAVRNITFFNTTIAPKTVFMKNGEYGDLQQIIVKPFRSVTVTEPVGVKTYFSSDADTWFVNGTETALVNVELTKWGNNPEYHHGLVKLWNAMIDAYTKGTTNPSIDLFQSVEYEGSADKIVFLTSVIPALIPNFSSK